MSQLRICSQFTVNLTDEWHNVLTVEQTAGGHLFRNETRTSNIENKRVYSCANWMHVCGCLLIHYQISPTPHDNRTRARQLTGNNEQGRIVYCHH